jgi:zinc-binding alcohol dehydrogenase/oxidoreductase
MQAIVIHEWGDSSVLRHEQVPEPAVQPGHALVELRAAALNRHDIGVRAGAYGEGLPLIIGSDGAGVRRDTGEEVVILPSMAWGDAEDAPGPDFRILGGPRDQGTYAELISVPEENLYPKPAHLSWEEAAALPLAGLTAYRALFTRARVVPDETVLVLGAGSGVSAFAVSLARQAGARVIVTSSSAEKLARARELGADAGVDYTQGDWADEVRELTGGTGVDVVIDSVAVTWPDSLRCLRLGGRLVTFGATGGASVEVPARRVYFGQISIHGTTMGSPREFARLLALVRQDAWRPQIDSVRPLSDAVAAHERMESGAHFGKLVLEIA